MDHLGHLVCLAPRVHLASLALRVLKELLVLMALMVSLVLLALMGHLETEEVPAYLVLMVLLVSEVHRVPRGREESRENQAKWELLAPQGYKGPQVLLARGVREESLEHLDPLDLLALGEEKVTRDLLVNLDKWEFLELLVLR